MAGTWGKSPYDTSGGARTAAVGVDAQGNPTSQPHGGWRGASRARADSWMNRSANQNAPTAPPLPGGGKPAAAPGSGAEPAMGTESGPGILENWFNRRASGTDPAYEYTMGRGMDAIDNRMAAGGSFNSGARGQQLSDFGANMGAQRMSSLDSLAGGASGEHQGRLNSMFQQMLGLSSGQAGLAGAYDISAANNMSASDQAILQMMLNKAGVDSKADQGFLNNLFSAVSLGKSK